MFLSASCASVLLFRPLNRQTRMMKNTPTDGQSVQKYYGTSCFCLAECNNIYIYFFVIIFLSAVTRLSPRSHLQDVEPGNGSGDRHAEGPPEQRGVRQILSVLLSGLLRLHLLHQGLGHPRLGQVCPHVHVSFRPRVRRLGKLLSQRDGGAFSDVGMDEGLVLSLCFTCRHVLKRAFKLKSASWERYDGMFYGCFWQCAVNCGKSDFSDLFFQHVHVFFFFLFSIPHQFLWAGGVR